MKKKKTIIENDKKSDREIIDSVKNNDESVVKRKPNLKFILGIIILIFFVILSYIGLLYYQKTIIQRGLSKIENNGVVFFYPDTYSQIYDNSGSIVYVSQNKNKYGGLSSVRTLSEEVIKSSDQIKDKVSCGKWGEGVSKGNSGESKLKIGVENVQYYEFFGTKHCSLKVNFETNELGIDGKIVLEMRLIIKDNTAKGVIVNYDDETSSNEVDKLRRSIENFDVK